MEILVLNHGIISKYYKLIMETIENIAKSIKNNPNCFIYYCDKGELIVFNKNKRCPS